MKPKKIWFDKERIYLKINDGQIGSLMLKDFPLLYNATDKQKNKYTLSPFGIHWKHLDEDLCFDGFFYK